MEKFQQLLAHCKCGVHLTINENKNYYETAKKYLEELKQKGHLEEVSEEEIKNMIKLDRIIELQFYPNTPIGFYIIYHYDLKKAIEKALEILRSK